MSTLDLIIIIPIAIGFVFGLFKGLIKELTSLAAIFLGIFGAKLFSPAVSTFFMKHFSFSEKIAVPVAYLVVFIIIAIILLLVARSVDKLFDSISLGGLNKFLGGLFGGIKYALILSILLNIFNAIDSKFSLVNPEMKTESFAYEHILKLAPTLWEEVKKQNVVTDYNPQNNEKKLNASD
ncbi:MAG: CvpA family protein [Paludibacter sp.]|nr:CvpA family protein [Paludibacter sp.]